MIEVYTDGASRGNPGKAAIGFSIYGNGGKLHEDSRFIGIATNNQAEYRAMLFAVEKAKEFDNEAIFHSDSELLIKQLNGTYRIKNRMLKEIFLKIKGNERSFLRVEYRNLPRENERIKSVDKRLNRLLDEITKKREKEDW
jgi:Ribonuclease HI